MGTRCILVAGAWKTDDNGLWEFVYDKGRMSSLVYIEENWSNEELRMIAAMEFGVNCFKKTFLSYSIPSCGSSSMGNKTTPVQLTTDVGVKTFVRVLSENKDVELFVTLNDSETPDSIITPVTHSKRKSIFMEGESTVETDGCQPMPSSSGSKNPKRSVTLDSSEPVPICFIDEAEEEQIAAAEQKMKSSQKAKGKGKLEDCPSFNLLDETDSSHGDGHLSDDEDVVLSDYEEVHLSDVDASKVRPMGYDKEFWEPLLDNKYGGTNVVEIMCEANSAFDHRVRISGPEPKFVLPKIDGEFPPIPDWSSHPHGRPPVVGDTSGVQRRSLGEVGDEEFDVAPLFDDLSYEISEIPDLENDDQDEDIYVGKTFGCKSDCQIALAIYAIKNMFHYKQSRTKKTYFVVSCSDTSCLWRVNAHEMKDTGYYQIRKAALVHTCSIETRSKFSKLATSRVIATMYKARLNNMGAGQRPMDVQQLLLEELRISASYFKCWKAQETANEDLRGNEEDSYLKLEEYLHMLKVANPGTVADVETEDNGVGGQRFLYMFLAFGASISGFRCLRPVIVIDGTHLVGKYKGVLLTASGQDGNFQVFPLAFAIVDSENDASWLWFLSKVERIIADSPSISIISDRNGSIYKAVQKVFPKAHHGACVLHLARNVVSRFKSKGLAKMVVKAACAYRMGDFKDTWGKIIELNETCAVYLYNIGLGHWSRTGFVGNRYNLMTSNVAETLNNALRKGRKSPITELIMFIQSMLTRWFSSRRKAAMEHRGPVTPEVDKVITSNLGSCSGSRVVNITDWSCEVLGKFGYRDTVDLKAKQCTCKLYDKTKIPCGHALLAADYNGLPYGQLAGDFYSTTQWAKTYEGIVQPHEDPRDGDIPEEISSKVILPPNTRRPSGRPKEKRIPSIGEMRKRKDKKGGSNRCGRCKGSGHNRVSCTAPI